MALCGGAKAISRLDAGIQSDKVGRAVSQWARAASDQSTATVRGRIERRTKGKSVLVHASGFTQVTWNSAKDEAKDILKGYAKRRQMVPYSDFVALLQSITLEPYDHRLAMLLDEISAEESNAGRGMLSALVVHKRDDMQPGRGFFELAKRLGHPVGDIEKFWIQEVKRLFERWSA